MFYKWYLIRYRRRYRVKNFNKEKWEKIKQKHILDLLSAKFQPGSDLAIKLLATNSEKTLVEAGKSKGFAIGIALSHPDIFRKTNGLGRTYWVNVS